MLGVGKPMDQDWAMKTREIFFALGDPTRFKIMETLALDGPMVALDIASMFETSRGAVAQHLKILKDAGLVESEALQRFRVYRIRTEGFEEIEDWVISSRKLWANSRNRDPIKPEEQMTRAFKRSRPRAGPFT